MKQTVFSLILLISVLFAGSCKKVIETKRTTSKISYKVDGVLREASGEEKVVATSYKAYKTIQIIGSTGIPGKEAINVSISEFHGEGEYNAEDDFTGVYSTDLASGETFLGITGSVKVTSYTNNILKGEFQFRGERADGAVKMITEGKFEVKLLDL